MIPLLLSAFLAAMLITRANAPAAPIAPQCYRAVPQHLTLMEIESLASSVGFPRQVAREMALIGWRESIGNAWAVNRHGRDLSIGLWQINIKARGRLRWFGLREPSELLDPATNARAAFQLWSSYGLKPWGQAVNK
jgi:hypothetical protein